MVLTRFLSSSSNIKHSVNRGKAFALDSHRYAQDDGVVLATEAPAEAIISALFQIDDSYCEAEYVLDCRVLKRVHVVDPLPQRSSEDWTLNVSVLQRFLDR
jgi:hypothetical protein